MDLDDWMRENKVQYKDFADAIGTTKQTLHRIRSGNLPSILFVIEKIEELTWGKVRLKDICKILDKKKKIDKKKEKDHQGEKNS